MSRIGEITRLENRHARVKQREIHQEETLKGYAEASRTKPRSPRTIPSRSHKQATERRSSPTIEERRSSAATKQRQLLKLDGPRSTSSPLADPVHRKRRVIVRRRSSQPFGFGFRGNATTGLFINRLNNVHYDQGHLRVGDRILEVDGNDCQGVGSDGLEAYLEQTDRAELVVREDPQGFDAFNRVRLSLFPFIDCWLGPPQQTTTGSQGTETSQC